MSKTANVAQRISTCLSCNFFATLESFDNEFESAIAGRPVSVLMPVLGVANGELVSLAPEMDGLQSDDLWNGLVMRGGSMWARFIPMRNPPHQPHIANISMLGLRATLRSADLSGVKALRKLERRADDWWVAVTSWIEVLSGQDIKQIGPARQLWHNGTHVQFFPLNADERQESTVRAARPDVTGIVNSKQLRASFIHAGNGILPPDEWLFLRDARSLFRAGEYRRALIDVGSAAEVALARIVERELAKRGESTAFVTAKLAAMDSQTLGTKIGYVENHLKLRKLPHRFKSVVVDKRNDAVHLRPTRKIDAERAIDKVTKLVERATPSATLAPPI